MSLIRRTTGLDDEDSLNGVMDAYRGRRLDRTTWLSVSEVVGEWLGRSRGCKTVMNWFWTKFKLKKKDNNNNKPMC